MILDAGALIAYERQDRDVLAMLDDAVREDEDVTTHAIVVAQTWRDGAQQARLARLLNTIETKEIDEAVGRRCGELLATAETADPIDATVVLLAQAGDHIITSDPEDISTLVRAAGSTATVVPT